MSYSDERTYKIQTDLWFLGGDLKIIKHWKIHIYNIEMVFLAFGLSYLFVNRVT